MISQTTKERLYFLYLSDTGPTRFWSIFVAIFAGVGVALRGDDLGGDVALLLTAAPWYVWSSLLGGVATARWIGLVSWTGNTFTHLMVPGVSIVVWVMFFAAGLVAPNFGLSILFLVPALQETWILSRVVYDEGLIK